MTFSSPRRIAGNVIAVLALVCLSSCAVPLAPSYQIEKQSITVRFFPGSPPHLAIRAEYRLANVGNAALDSIELGLPSEKAFGLANLRVKIDGHEATPQRERSEEEESGAGESALASAWPATWRIPLASRWSRRERRNLVVEYDLAATTETDPRMSVGPNAFYLNDSGWFPDPLEPKALFAKDVVRPDPSDSLVDVPANFVVTASGELRGTHKAANETEFRFRLRKGDPEPFVVAGAYHQQQISSSGMAISFWTLEPFSSAALEKAADSLASIDNFLVTTFDARSAAEKSLLVLEAPAPGPNSGATPLHDRSVTLPGIIVLWPAASSTDLAAQLVSENLKERLALSRFEHVITPRPEAWLLGDSLATYAVMLANPNSGVPPARAGVIRQRIAHFDQLGNEAAERPIAFVTSGDIAQQREMGSAKSTLFLFALEDRCGRENVEHALAHMVYALRGQEYGYTDFRSAIEQECHQDLSSMFATWLEQKGIPADFRARYESKNKSAN